MKTTMAIEFAVDFEDMKAAFWQMHRKSAFFRYRRFIQFFVLGVIWGVPTWVMFVEHREPVPFGKAVEMYQFSVAFTLLLSLLLWKSSWRNIVKRLRREWQDGVKKGRLGQTRATITDEHFSYQTEIDQQVVKWAVVERVEVSEP